MKRILYIVIPVLLLLVLVGWRIDTKTTAKNTLAKQSAASRSAPIVVATAVAKPAEIAANVTTTGTIESPFQVKLSPNIAGRIDYLQVREGDAVHVGDVLARIDPEYVEGQILQAQGNLAEAKQKLVQARITEQANTATILNAIGEANALVASTAADYNEAEETYQHSVGAAQEAVLDAKAKVASANSTVLSSKANLNLAKANLEDASAKYKRTDYLYKQGFDYAQDLDDQKAAEKVDEATVNSNEMIVEANQSAMKSAEDEELAAEHQLAIAEKLGMSTIQDDKAKWKQAKQALTTAVANKSQIPAYTESLEALYSEVVAAKAALNQAVAQRQYLIVKSSIEGTVTQRLFDPGAEAVPGTPLLIIQAMSPLFMTASLPVEDSQYVHAGMDVRVQLDALPGRVFHQKLKDINNVADPTSRQFMIRTVVDNSSGMFRPGMYCKVQATTTHLQAPITVPREAVITDTSNSSTVTTVDSNSVAHIVPVTVGLQDASNIQILSGVKVGDRVIVLTYRKITEGAKVTEGSWDQLKQKGKPVGHGGPNTDPSANLANSPSMAGGSPQLTTGTGRGTAGGAGGGSASGASGSATGTGAANSAGPAGGAVGNTGTSGAAGTSGVGGAGGSGSGAAGGAGAAGGGH
jgi:RND family efflux transporter MFP subunit